jgi:hypothetical protein
VNAMNRRKRAILRNRRRGLFPFSLLTAPDPFKVLQGVTLHLPSEREVWRRIFGSLPPRIVDGPGCTPAVVDRGGLDMETKLRRGLLDEDQEEEGEPLIQPLTGFDLYLTNKYRA